jgi:Cysteine-rich secretory protein family
MRKATIVQAGLALLCAALAVPIPARAQDAQHVFDLTNNDRVAQGLQPLRWDPALAAAAQAHAERMAEQKALSHQFPGEPDLSARAAQAGAHFSAIAENIASAYNDLQIESAWMHSTPHRQNILDPQMNAIGVAIIRQGNVLYAVEDFANVTESLSPEDAEARVAELLRQQGIDPSISRQAAVAACDIDNGYPPGASGRLIVRFGTSDLSQLPQGVAKQIHNGPYTKAAVAACPNPHQSSFTTYRMVIALY